MLPPATLRLLPRAAAPRYIIAARTLASSPRASYSTRSVDRLKQELDVNQINDKRQQYERNRKTFLVSGVVAGVISFIYTAWKLKRAIAEKNARESSAVIKCDAPPIPTETFKKEAGEVRKIVIHDKDGNELVPTGNATVPVFPRTIDFSLPSPLEPPKTPAAAAISVSSGSADTQYTLVGLGMRTVTFIGIQVYLVGLYVATSDIARLQHYLVKSVNPLATTLIPAEKDTLRRRLLDPVEGEALWRVLLEDAGLRSLVRISPVRDTDFHHLRDGFVRAIQARTQRDKAAFADDAFAESMKAFKAIFNRGSVPKKKEMLLCRGESGALAVTYDDSTDKEPHREILGTVTDPRLSKLLWLNYLAGSSVASEPARKNIVEGVMEFVERPVGTVAAQVV